MRHRPWPRLALGLLAVAAAGSGARADIVTSDQRGVELTLRHARATGELVDGTVRWRVRYDVVNPARYADAASITLELPLGATVVGLRHQSGGTWIAGRLLASDAAQARYDGYLDTPFTGWRGAALLTSESGYATLRLSLIPGDGTVAVEYDLIAPACYAHGTWIADPPAGSTAPAITLRGGQLRTGAALAKAWGEPPSAACDGSGAVVGADDVPVATWPGPATGVTATVATVTAGATRAHDVELVVGATLAAAPVRPAVVFVVDASKSQGVDGIAAQLAIVRGYLTHAADARVEIVVTRREATRLFGRLVPAAQVDALLQARAAALTPGNGSHLDRGLAVAARILADARGPRRLLAFTDDRLRPSLTDPALHAALAALPADAVAHVVLANVGDTSVAADREHHLAAAIDGWGGIVADVGSVGSPAPLEELVRPTRLEDLRVGDEELGDLTEGHGLRRVTVSDAAPAVSAWIWGRRVATTALTAPVDRIRTARLAIGLGLIDDDLALRGLAGLAGAATRVTSFLADRPSWTPGGLPDEPLDDLGLRGASASYDSMCGLPMGVGRYGTIGHGVGAGHLDDRPRPDVAPLLRPRVAGCLASATGAQVHVDVITTGIEVVDVAAHATGVTDPAVAARVEACAIEAGWALDLDASFARYVTTFGADFGG